MDWAIAAILAVFVVGAVGSVLLVSRVACKELRRASFDAEARARGWCE